MKAGNLILLIFVLIVIFVFISGKSGNFGVRYYAIKSSNSVESEWQNYQTSGSVSTSDEAIEFPLVSYIVTYHSKKIGDVHTANPVRLDISDIGLGPLWIPLYKKSDYTYTVRCKNSYHFQTDIGIKEYTINGKVTIYGHYTIIGSCSAKTARDLIVDKVMKDIYAEVKKNSRINQPSVKTYRISGYN